MTLAETRLQAATRAKAFCDAQEAGGSRDGIVSVRIEEWVGILTEGEWKPVSLWHGGFSHRFATHFSSRNARNADDRNPSLPRTSDRVECVLLVEKTRKGGWKAQLLQRGTEGPITNSGDLPKSAKAGQTVTLRVGRDRPGRQADSVPLAGSRQPGVPVTTPALAMPPGGKLACSHNAHRGDRPDGWLSPVTVSQYPNMIDPYK